MKSTLKMLQKYVSFALLALLIYYRYPKEVMLMSHGNKEIFATNLKKHISFSSKDRKEIAQDLGIPYSTLTDWINANKYPRIDNIEKVAEYFGVSKSDLIEDFEAKRKDNETLAKIIVKLRMDAELLEVVEKVVALDKTRRDGLRSLLDTFIK
jgi:repressor LexA